jgi:hypothetical protein
VLTDAAHVPNPAAGRNHPGPAARRTRTIAKPILSDAAHARFGRAAHPAARAAKPGRQNWKMASPARLELATLGLGNQCSIRLSYGDFFCSGPLAHSDEPITSHLTDLGLGNRCSIRLSYGTAKRISCARIRYDIPFPSALFTSMTIASYHFKLYIRQILPFD